MTIRRSLLLLSSAVAAACIAGAFVATDASAQSTTLVLSYPRGQGHVLQGFGNASGVPLSFSTTSYADVAGASVAVTPMVDPNAAQAPGGQLPADYIQVKWSADAQKATAGTGTCAVYVNGAIVAQSARSVASAGGQDELGGVAMVKNSVTGTQTVKLQCKSSDTNALTINNATIIVDEVF